MERIEFPVNVDQTTLGGFVDKNGRNVTPEEIVKVANVLYGHGLLFNKLKRLVELKKSVKLTQEGEEFAVNSYSGGGRYKMPTFEEAVAGVPL